jgi:hypothetical protein
MRRGRIVAEYDSETMTMDRVMASAFAAEVTA